MTIDRIFNLCDALEAADTRAMELQDALPQQRKQLDAIRRELARCCADAYAVLQAVDPEIERQPPALPATPQVLTRALPAAPAPAAPSTATLASLAALERIADGIGALVELKATTPLPAPPAPPAAAPATVPGIDALTAAVSALAAVQAPAATPPPAPAPAHRVRFAHGATGRTLPSRAPAPADPPEPEDATVRTGDVAAELGMDPQAFSDLIRRRLGGVRIGLQVGGWQIVALGGKGQRTRPRWRRVEQEITVGSDS
jgi:hypothetical protein